MKNTFRVLTLVGAVALLLGILMSGSGTVSAQVLGTVTFKDGTSTDATAVSFGTNDTSSLGAIVAVHVLDADLVANNNTSTVKSDSDGTGITLPLISRTATGTVSGLFVLGTNTGTTTIVINANGATATLPVLKTKHGDSVTATYTDATTNFGNVDIAKILTVDAKGPEFSGLTPGDGTITKTSSQTYQVNVKDASSGVNETAGTYGFLINTTAATTTGVALQSPLTTSDFKEGDTKVGITFSIPLGLTGNVWISARAVDKAGNTAEFDTKADTAATDMAKVIIDTGAPTLGQIYTGVAYDATKARSLTANKKNSLLVVFSDPGALTKLDVNSVTAGDFSVAGHTVSSADVFASAVASSTAVASLTPGDGGVDVALGVFLTLAADMGPGDKPGVTVIGTVADEAGNAHVSTGSITPNDRIAPTFTVSDITPTLAGKDETVTFTITADEALSTDDPATVSVTNLEDSTLLSRTIASSGTNKWSVTTGKVGKSATHSIYVAGADSAANAGTTGNAGTTSTIVGATDIIEFETDVALKAPGVTPADADTVTTRDPFFVTFDFDATTDADGIDEVLEFVGDSNKTITITKVELDGVDVSADLSSEDNVKFLLAVSGITSAEHTVVFNAEDQAGNKLAADKSFKFTVEDRSKFSISLQPGWNLISLPGDPDDGDINSVFADLPGVSEVVTYDANVPGGTLSAVRDDTGSLVGTLENIDSKKGYWVNSAKFKKLEVAVDVLQAGQVATLPPSIPIVEGWNLIPVVDITGLKVANDTTTAAGYLDSIIANITRAYTFDTVANNWILVDHDLGFLTFGKGYFVYSTKKGILVP